MHFVTLTEDAGDDELKESCLQAFEALALRCFREITPYIKEVWSAECVYSSTKGHFSIEELKSLIFVV